MLRKQHGGWEGGTWVTLVLLMILRPLRGHQAVLETGKSLHVLKRLFSHVISRSSSNWNLVWSILRFFTFSTLPPTNLPSSSFPTNRELSNHLSCIEQINQWPMDFRAVTLKASPTTFIPLLHFISLLQLTKRWWGGLVIFWSKSPC